MWGWVMDLKIRETLQKEWLQALCMKETWGEARTTHFGLWLVPSSVWT